MQVAYGFYALEVQLHLQSGSYVNVGEILTKPPDVKYNDVLLCTKLGSCGDPSGRDPQTLRTDRDVDSKTQIHS
jgi:hypothetical protein